MVRVSGILFLSVVAGVLTHPALGQTLMPGRSYITPEGSVTEAAVAAVPQGNQPDRVSVLVHLAPGADRGPVRAFAGNVGGHVKYEYNVVLPNVINLRDIPVNALNGLLATPGVVRWEDDKQVQAHMNDSTPLIRALQSQITGAGFSANGAGVRVCIIDTGIDSDSIMYSDRIDAAAGRDFVNNDNNPEDDNGHGSHVAGTAVGGDHLSVNFGCVGSEPFHGVAPEATLIGLKALSSTGSGSFSNIIAAIDYGADQSPSGGRCDVINMSLGGGQFSGTCDGDSAAAAANNAVDAGVVVVASSGNNNYSNAMGTPACGSKVIAVGATYDDNYPNCEFPTLDSFSFCTAVNFGGICTASCTDNSPNVDQIGCYSNASTELDVVAPGCVTFSTDFENSTTGIVGFCGTSMASPHVAGLAALLLSADSSLTPADVRTVIRGGAIDLGPAGFDNDYGHGRIDALNSLALLGPGCSSNGDCDDGNACTTDTCSNGSCSNTPINCDDGNACTADSCDSGTGNCVNTSINCDDGNPCTTDSCDPASGCVHQEPACGLSDGCCPSGCDSGSDPDCVASAVCGNDICEAWGGENCTNCSADCNGVQNGRPTNRYCCGDGGGTNPVPCSDPRCTGSGNTCED
jgi:serine protease AprX